MRLQTNLSAILHYSNLTKIERNAKLLKENKQQQKSYYLPHILFLFFKLLVSKANLHLPFPHPTPWFDIHTT